MDAPTPRETTAIAGDATTPTTALPWEDGLARLSAATFVWFTTTRPDGAPHSRPVLSVWVDDALCTTSNPGAVKARNLGTNQRCSVAVSTDGMDLALEGIAARVDDEVRLERIAAAYDEKYGWTVRITDRMFDADYGAPTAGPPPYAVFAITPTVAFGFGTNDELAPRSARWRF